MTSAHSLPPRALMEHDAFMRRIAIALLGDEHRAADAVQETYATWLTRPPKSANPRGWLRRVVTNHARGLMRGDESRRRRERAVASERTEGGLEELEQRATIQREVVDGVLALAEPYRAVVLLRYYEGLQPSEIARRLGRPAGSVRAQLARAHEQLRTKLDHEYGTRAQWAVALAPLTAVETLAVARSVALATTVLVAVGAGVGAHAWLKPAPSTKLVQPRNEPALVPPPAKPRLKSAAQVRAALPATRQVVAPRAEDDLPALPAGVTADTSSARDLVRIAVQARRVLQERLLTPDPSLVRRYADLIASGTAGVARLLPNEGPEPLLFPNGGGSRLTFRATSRLDHLTADVRLAGDYLVAPRGGALIELGDVSLAAFPTQAERLPAGLDPDLVPLWDCLWHADRTACAKNVRGISASAKLAPGRSYLLRAPTDRFDTLAALRVFPAPDGAYDLAWRILVAWPREHSGKARAKPVDMFWVVPDAPMFASMSTEDLRQVLASARAHARRLLLTPEADAVDQAGGDNVVRFVESERFNMLLGRAWGTDYCFTTGAFERSAKAQITYRFGSYLTGRDNYLLNVGDLSLDELHGPDGQPAFPGAREREAWELLWSPLLEGEGRRRRIPREVDKRLRQLDLDKARGFLGATYLLRTAKAGEANELFGFRILADDEHGQTIAWRKLYEWPIERDEH